MVPSQGLILKGTSYEDYNRRVMTRGNSYDRKPIIELNANL
jgi:hypothetical protein